MSGETIALVASLFISFAVIFGGAMAYVLGRTAPERRRLRQILENRPTSVLLKDSPQLAETEEPFWDNLARKLPPPIDISRRLRRDLEFAGWDTAKAAVIFAVTQPILGALFAVGGFMISTGSRAMLLGLMGAAVGYMAPGFLLNRRIKDRRRKIENGLADALDLLVLCLEAGSSLDQAIVKATEELAVSYPVLAEQLAIIIAEMRAGKARIDAFRGFAERTKVDDTRALVSMLVQTDRFGTSIGQALRTQASVCRNKRRQRAEEAAEKVGIKLVFPLVFFLFPALFTVILGPAIIRFTQVFGIGR
jgi:tight adherence protein C